MIKKTVTFTNYNDQEVTKSYYFNIDKLEAAELELEYGDLIETVEELLESSDGKKVYGIFKEIILNAVGQKSADGNSFIKNQQIRDEFAGSPALGEIIMDMFKNPEAAGPFLEGMLPASMLAEARAQEEREKLEALVNASGTGDVPTLTPVAPVLEETPKERTDEEIQTLPVSELTNEEMKRLIALRESADS